MIYLPKHFEESRTELVHEIIRMYNFATLITVRDGRPAVSHLPFIFDSDHNRLLGHMARANPQWRSFQPGTEVTVVFHGPHAYISPALYQPQPDHVPTWNYAVVHVHGAPRVIAAEPAAYDIMQQLVKDHDHEWSLDLPENIRRELLREIVVFEIPAARIEAKFKLSQNRPDADRQNVAASLAKDADQGRRETAELMQRVWP